MWLKIAEMEILITISFSFTDARPSGRTDEEVSLNGGANGHAKVPIVRPANRAS